MLSIFLKAFEQQKMSITVDIKTVTDLLALFFSVFIVLLLMTLMKQMYEQKILQELQIVNMTLYASMQSTRGYSMEDDIKHRLTKGQLKYAMKKGWVTEHYLIYI